MGTLIKLNFNQQDFFLRLRSRSTLWAGRSRAAVEQVRASPQKEGEGAPDIKMEVSIPTRAPRTPEGK